MSEREEFEQWYKREFGRRPTVVGYESDITWRAWQRATWQARAQHGADLTQIAKSKIDQMGGTICGVLVRNEAGALAAVHELGRVTWLDGADGGTGKDSKQINDSTNTDITEGAMPSENELNKTVEDSRSQGPDPKGFDFNHPTYCEIIENIHASVFRLLEAGRHDAETLLDDDEAIEHVLCKKIDMAAEQLAHLFEESGRDDGYPADDVQKLDAGAGQWLIQLRGEYLFTRGVWVKRGHKGYTNDIHEAGRFSESEARHTENLLPNKYQAVCLTQPPQGEE